MGGAHEFIAELKAEGFSRCTFEITPENGMGVKLTVIHEAGVPKSTLIEKVSNGWPKILSSLKSLLETGEPLESTKRWPKGL